MKRLLGIISLFIFILFIFSLVVPAQAALPPGFKEDFNIIQNPRIPTPGEDVSLRVESFSLDLNRLNIIWEIDGVVQSQGKGLLSKNITAPLAGQRTTIKATVFKENGEELSSSVVLAPANVDLMYESDTYTPPLYKGRAMFSHQSIVKVLAVPEIIDNGLKIKSSDVIYTWEKDGVVLQDFSGVGKDSIIFKGRLISTSFVVTVTAKSPISGIAAKKSISIKPIDPSVVIYKSSPSQGSIFENPLIGTEDMETEEFGFVAIPYYFSVSNKDSSDLIYKWTENGEAFDDPTASSDIIFTNKDLAGSGSAQIKVNISNKNIFQQSENAGFSLNVIGSNTLNNQNNDETTIF